MARKYPEGEFESEREFLDAYDVSAFERPSVSVDVVIVTVPPAGAGERLQALVEYRSWHPHRERWGLPGSFIRMDESLDQAAARALREKTGLTGVYLEQLYTFGAPGRDPRTRVVTTVYYALVDAGRIAEGVTSGTVVLADLDVPWSGVAPPGGGGDGSGAVRALHPDSGKPLPLAFDHAEILGMAVQRLRGKLSYTTIGYELVPERFTLAELRRVHEVILGRGLNKDSFRRKVLASGDVRATGEHQRDVGHRPAELYEFTSIGDHSRHSRGG